MRFYDYLQDGISGRYRMYHKMTFDSGGFINELPFAQVMVYVFWN
jgi:hypothetical protein